MECFVLGSGGMMPMPHRFLSSVAVRTQGEIYLFDAGEGTQIPYKKHHLGLRSLRVVACTHMHADHVLGLPGMMMLRAQMPDPAPLTVIGPTGIRKFIQHLREDLRMYINYTINTIEWTPQAAELAYEDEFVRIKWYPLEHTVTCIGYRLEEHERPGRFDAERAQTLGIPFGPLYGKLQRGESVEIDGKIVTPQEVVGPIRRGRHVAFATDTVVTPLLQPVLKGADIAFVESMFLPEHEQDAFEKKHMTVHHAAQAAKDANVKKLVIVHTSPRYEGKDLKRFGPEARTIHQNAQAARDGDVHEIPLID